MIAELTQWMLGIEEVLRGVAQAVGALSEQMRVQIEQQAKLIELVTPKEKPKSDGPRLDELLAAIVIRLDAQNHLLKDVGDVVSRAVTALPLSVVAAIDDAFGRADEPPKAPTRNGSAGGEA